MKTFRDYHRTLDCNSLEDAFSIIGKTSDQRLTLVVNPVCADQAKKALTMRIHERCLVDEDPFKTIPLLEIDENVIQTYWYLRDGKETVFYSMGDMRYVI